MDGPKCDLQTKHMQRLVKDSTERYCTEPKDKNRDWHFIQEGKVTVRVTMNMMETSK